MYLRYLLSSRRWELRVAVDRSESWAEIPRLEALNLIEQGWPVEFLD